MEKKYKSKIGLELVIPLTLIFGVALFATVINKPNWLVVAILLPVMCFIVHMFLTTCYTIENKVLRIKCGFLYDSQIDVFAIRKIEETNNPLSSPATSLDRLEISYNDYDSVIISPKKKVEFINDLKSINPGIEVKFKKLKNAL
ncbi:PH domain-containing protein [Parapedobacter koreensis]|uniref:PH domain-containing protein n=1 Tax=Parapedobacter koreensis TaxID=332977 RepID=A0A1H7T926_9SPHI|nr:PH domain-containing protein [Parapedobacter koreensis]SEL81243.1 PH domain-containing protein [Parapedobacter koreensis]